MFDEYLKRQNKWLTFFSVLISTSAVVHAAFLVGYGHIILALLEFCIAIAMCSGVYGLINKNKEFIKKWNAMNSVEYAAFDLNDSNDLEENVTLNFDFKKPSE